MRVETIHPGEIGPAETALWRAHQAADPDLASPYFTPEWAKIIGGARADARICVLAEGQGFLGVQRPSRFAAMGLGAPLSDYQGVVGAPDLAVDAAALCSALRVGRIDLAGVPAAQSVLSGRAGGGDASWIADVSGGLQAYRAHLKAHRGKVVRQIESRLRKLGQAAGEVVFTPLSRERRHFQTLLAWKHAQLCASGQPAIWSTPWVRRVLDACFDAEGEEFSGALFTLTAGGKLAAASFCLRSRRALHAWVLGHHSFYDCYAPGVALSHAIIEWAAQNGLSEVDFGGGDYQFKRHLATTRRPIVWGAAARPSWAAAVREAEVSLRRRIERSPRPQLAALPGKAMRRLDLMRALG